MLPENIILQSAGSLSVAIIALLILILQILFFFKKRQIIWYAWSGAISFSAFLYSVGIFIEYNTLQGAINRFSGILEFTAIIFLVHSMFGFTFSYLGIEHKRYHSTSGMFHFFVLLVLWFTDYIVADGFIARNFINLPSSYIEPALGPLGPVFEFYAASAAVYAMTIWFRHKGIDPKYRKIFLIGMGLWIVLGIHDGLASMGFPAFQYVMEYGFLGFALAILWVVINSHLEIEADEKYRVVTEFADECIMMVQDGKIVFGNPASRDLVGMPLSDVTIEVFFNMIHSEDRKFLRNNYEILVKGDSVSNPHTVRMRDRDREQRFIEIVANSILYRNKPAILAVMRDITERKREAEALRRSEEKLARSKKMESLGLLAGGVAHDLNNVLSGIINYPELILMDLPDNSRLRKAVKAIQETGNRAVAIVQDLLTVARGIATARESIKLNDIIMEYINSPEFNKLRQFYPRVTIKTELDADLFNVSISPIHLRKALMNLVSNASEAIDGMGNVIISTANCYVDRPIRGYDDVKTGEYAVLSVLDDGPGIPAEEVEQIFEPFYTKKVLGRSGTGLGLTVVWNVMQDHKGYIDVISNRDGTEFRLYFPITRQEMPQRDLSVSVDQYKGNGESILVVDDVESQRDITSSILNKLDYRVKAVSSGEEAVEYLKSHSADLMVLDMIMDPGINGRETYERIIKIHSNQKAVIVSGFAETEEVSAAQKLGAGKYIKKPFTFEKLGLAVQEELAKE